MGWKSTKEINRKEAVQLILAKILDATNNELSSALDAFGYGENTEFIVLDKVPKISPVVCFGCANEGQSMWIDPCHSCDNGSLYKKYENK